MQAALQFVDVGHAAGVKHRQNVAQHHEKGLCTMGFVNQGHVIFFPGNLVAGHRNSKFLLFSLRDDEREAAKVDFSESKIGGSELRFKSRKNLGVFFKVARGLLKVCWFWIILVGPPKKADVAMKPIQVL